MGMNVKILKSLMMLSDFTANPLSLFQLEALYTILYLLLL